MHLKSIALVNFKNYEDVSIELSPDINVFIGHNGAGKTNMLDAVHFLSFCRSFLNPIDRQSIRFDQKFFLLQGSFFKEDRDFGITCAVKEGQKKVVKKNKQEYDKLSDHIGRFPAVVISPYDTNLIIEGSETRRKFIDSIISQFDRNYLDTLIRYNKVLKQRNALLKQFQEMRIFDNESIEVWDAQLIALGEVIYEKRTAFLIDFIPVFQKFFDVIADHKEAIDISYKSQLDEEDFKEALEKNKRKDNAVGYTTVGIHKDDLVFLINGQPIKKFGSQGQQKSFLIALKLAQFEIVSQLLKTKPILLLDDIFDKLDHDRVSHLMQLISEHIFGQVFISDTDKDRMRRFLKGLTLTESYLMWKEGKLKKDRNQNGISMKEALDGYFKALGIDEKIHETRILSQWENLVGEAVHKRTVNKYIRDRVLYLEINSSVMRDELQHDKKSLIKKINAAAGCELIVDIFFK